MGYVKAFGYRSRRDDARGCAEFEVNDVVEGEGAEEGEGGRGEGRKGGEEVVDGGGEQRKETEELGALDDVLKLFELG